MTALLASYWRIISTADLGDYDNAELAELLEFVEHDLDGTGYDYDDLEDIAERLNPSDDGSILPEPGDAENEDMNMSYAVVVECEDENEQTELLEKFMEEGLKCKAIM